MEDNNNNDKKINGGISLIKIIGCSIVVITIFLFFWYYILNINKTNDNIEINDDYNYDGNGYDEEEDYVETKEFDYAKIKPDETLIYVKEKTEKINPSDEQSFFLLLPVVNLKFGEIKDINDKLEKYYNTNKKYYETVNEEEFFPEIYYNYSLYNDILDIELGYTLENQTILYENYYIDIKNEKIISRDEYLNKIGIDKKLLENLINDKILDRYLNTPMSTEKTVYKNLDEYINDIKYVTYDSKEAIEQNDYDSKKLSNSNNVVPHFEKYNFDYEKICNNCCIHYLDDENIEIKNIRLPKYVDPYYSIIISSHRNYLLNKSYSFRIKDTFENNEYFKTNKLPVINIESDDVKKINNELEKYFDNSVKVIQSNNDCVVLSTLTGSGDVQDEVFLNERGEKIIDDYYSMNFGYTIINDKILSVIVLEERNPGSYGIKSTKYLTYNIEINTGKLLSNKELFDRCDIDLNEFKEKLDAKLKLVFKNKDTKYNIDDLQISFDNPSDLFYEPVNNVRYDNYVPSDSESFEKLSVLGKDFDTYPHIWVDVFFDESKDKEAAEIKEKNSVLDVDKIQSYIDKYDGKNKEIKQSLSDNKEVLYYLFDFDYDEKMECLILYNNFLYVYKKGLKEPIFINGETNISLYEVIFKDSKRKELFMKSFNKHDICFESMMLSSITMEDGKFIVRPVFGYSCDTEAEEEIRRKINSETVYDYDQKQEMLKNAHTVKYYYNVLYTAAANTKLDLDYLIINDSRNIDKKEYDRYSKEFLNKYKLVYTNDKDPIFK